MDNYKILLEVTNDYWPYDEPDETPNPIVQVMVTYSLPDNTEKYVIKAVSRKIFEQGDPLFYAKILHDLASSIELEES